MIIDKNDKQCVETILNNNDMIINKEIDELMYKNNKQTNYIKDDSSADRIKALNEINKF